MSNSDLEPEDLRPTKRLREMSRSKIDSYKQLWDDLWNSDVDVYLQQHPNPSSGVQPEESTLTYQSYDFSSLSAPVLPGGNVKFTVRREYLILLEELVQLHLKRDPAGRWMRGVVVIGHPGIGL
jgi:hypothetical protein